MVDNAAAITIDSDVIIAPHHGGDNGSSKAFVEAVTPLWVIFSAGHKFGHPRKSAADRYLALPGTDEDHILRTDRGDNQTSNAGHDKEWKQAVHGNGHDKRGDDDIDIKVPKAGGADAITVAYRNP